VTPRPELPPVIGAISLTTAGNQQTGRRARQIEFNAESVVDIGLNNLPRQKYRLLNCEYSEKRHFERRAGDKCELVLGRMIIRRY
jgi:hypothetical protein